MKHQLIQLVQQTLPTQLLTLIESYEHEIEHLHKKINELENQRISSSEIPTEPTKLDLIEDWLEKCQEATKHNDVERLNQIAASLLSPATIISKMTEEERIIALYKIFDYVALSENKFDTIILQLLIKLHDLQMAKPVRQIIKDEYEFFLQNLIVNKTNHSLIINLLTINNLNQILNIYLRQIIEGDNPQLFETFTQQQLVQIYWLSFAINQESAFLQKCLPNQIIAIKKDVLSPFSFIDENKKITKHNYNKLKHPLNHSPLFSEQKKAEIFTKLNSLLLEDLITSPQVDTKVFVPTFNRDNLHIVKDEDILKFQQKFNLKQQEILALTYSPQSKKPNSRHMTVKAYVSPLHDSAFIREKDVRAFNQQHKPQVVRASMNYYDFKWPSTDIEKKGNTANQNELFLKEKSDLRELGYQVSSLTKQQRWSILQKAVQQLGLQKVAYTIANNIRRKKSVTNGEKIYAKAISEWNYDLNRLKQAYYKKSFKWPK